MPLLSLGPLSAVRAVLTCQDSFPTCQDSAFFYYSLVPFFLSPCLLLSDFHFCQCSVLLSCLSICLLAWLNSAFLPRLLTRAGLLLVDLFKRYRQCFSSEETVLSSLSSLCKRSHPLIYLLTLNDLICDHLKDLQPTDELLELFKEELCTLGFLQPHPSPSGQQNLWS